MRNLHSYHATVAANTSDDAQADLFFDFSSGKPPCKAYPAIPYLYIHVAKLEYAGVYALFLFLLQNIDCGYSLEPPNITYTRKKIQQNFQFLPLKNLCTSILHGQCNILVLYSFLNNTHYFITYVPFVTTGQDGQQK